MGLKLKDLPERIRKQIPVHERKDQTDATPGEWVESEKVLQNQIANYLRLNGITANQSRMDKRKTDVVGWPDFTFAVNGIPCVVEVKRPGESLTDDQKRVSSLLRENGWRFEVVTSIPELRDFLAIVNTAS